MYSHSISIIIVLQETVLFSRDDDLILTVCSQCVSRHGFGAQNYGNLIGQKFTCPLGRLHGGHGYCTYKGKWRHGLYWGEGEFICDDGRRYSGDWVRGQRHGQVKLMTNLEY